MNILQKARTLGLKLKGDSNAKATALAELARIQTELETVFASNAPAIWKKRRQAQLLFEQATAKRFVSSCR